jgi:hypothetical protein
MTKKLEEIFDLPRSNDQDEGKLVPLPEQSQAIIHELDTTIEKIEAALPTVRGLDTSDTELDELAKMATDSFNNLSDLGMNVDSRYASEIFAVAGNMLGHAITAKTAKLNKKLRMIDLQLKKARLDQIAAEEESAPVPGGTGMVLDRNELLERLIAANKEKPKT